MFYKHKCKLCNKTFYCTCKPKNVNPICCSCAIRESQSINIDIESIKNQINYFYKNHFVLDDDKRLIVSLII